MEYTQWEQNNRVWKKKIRLNPYCNGIYSMSLKWFFPYSIILCLNPCCNGIYSMRQGHARRKDCNQVLILVVMEYTQWVMLSRLQEETEAS